MDITFDNTNDNDKSHQGFGGDNRFQVFEMYVNGLEKGIPKLISKQYPIIYESSPTNLQLDIYLTDINKTEKHSDVHHLNLKINDMVRVTLRHIIDGEEISNYFERSTSSSINNHAQTLSECIVDFTDVFNKNRVKAKKKWLFF